MVKRPIIPAEVLSSDTQEFFDVLNKEPDLSVVIVAAAYIDACLGALLQKLFVESSVSSKLLDSRAGALGIYASRADACYSLGLISKALYQDLLVVAEIRNQFAHYHLNLNFTEPEIARRCQDLGYIFTLKNGDHLDEPMFKPGQLSDISDSRFRLIITVVIISQHLLVTALGVKKVEPRA